MIALALYKGKGDWVNAAIRAKGHSPYSHCELIVDGWMYSSTVRDGGVRCKIADNLKAENWDFIDLPWADANLVLDIYQLTKDNPYGWTDIIKYQLLNFPPNDGKGDFCSEWCAKALGIPDAQIYDPAKLGRLVKWRNQI